MQLSCQIDIAKLKILTLSMITFVFLIPGCGTETGNPGDEKDVSIVRDSVTLQVGSQLLEVSDALETSSTQAFSESGSNGLSLDAESHTLALASSIPEAQLTSKRSCTTEGTQAVFARSRAVSKPFSFTDSLGRTLSGLVEKNFENTLRLRRRDDVPVSCDPLGRFPILSLESYKQLTISAQFDGSVQRQRSLRSANGELLKESNATIVKKGERTTAFGIQNENTDNQLHTREITSKVEQEIEFSDGERTTKINSQILIESDQPLILKLKKSGILNTWSTATIESGRVTAVLPDGNRTETTFNNVVIDQSEPCAPKSGAIMGAHYTAENSSASALGEVSLKFEISFEDGVSWIRYDGEGERQELPFDLCPAVD